MDEIFKPIHENTQIRANIYNETDGSFTVSLEPIDIIESGNTVEDAINAAVDELKIYAQDYLERFQLFTQAPNRRDHLPFIMRILFASDDDEIKNMLDIIHVPPLLTELPPT